MPPTDSTPTSTASTPFGSKASFWAERRVAISLDDAGVVEPPDLVERRRERVVDVVGEGSAERGDEDRIEFAAVDARERRVDTHGDSPFTRETPARGAFGGKSVSPAVGPNRLSELELGEARDRHAVGVVQQRDQQVAHHHGVEPRVDVLDVGCNFEQGKNS